MATPNALLKALHDDGWICHAWPDEDERLAAIVLILRTAADAGYIKFNRKAFRHG